MHTVVMPLKLALSERIVANFATNIRKQEASLFHSVMLITLTVVCAVLFASLAPADCLWHPYDAQKKYEPQCTNTEENFKLKTKLVSQENRDKWKLWPDLVSQKDLIDGETMYGFEEAMEAIWKHQHPEDCSKVKYIISGGFESGFGSEFHVIGTALALAMNMNRVFVMFPDGQNSLMDKMNSNNRFQVDIDFCRKQKKFSLECYYEPWSQCTIEDALKGSTLQELRTQGLHLFMKDLVAMKDAPAHAYIAQLGGSSEVVPTALHSLYACSPFNPGKYRYWWRAVSAAFFMRPNEATRQLLLQHRQDKEMKFDLNQEQCVSVYVRRGDKHLEMKMIDDEGVFFTAAKDLWTTLQASPSKYAAQKKPIMFVGSEDPNVLDSAIAWGGKSEWEVKYSNLFDRHQVSTRLNATEQEIARKKNAFVHNEWEYFSMVLNIDAHLRCSAFVCTQRSNFCRVIDELRATVGHKANKPLADFSCGNPPPCIDSPNISVDWR